MAHYTLYWCANSYLLRNLNIAKKILLPEFVEALSCDMGEQQLKMESLGRFQVTGEK